MSFDFDQWWRLAQEDPEAFERQRREAVDALIAQATPASRAKLRGLQFRIDMERRRAGSALAGAQRMQQMLAEQLQQLSAAFERLVACGQQQSRPAPECKPVAPVLPMQRHQ